MSIDEPAWPGPALAWATVALLFVTYIASFVDRTVLTLLIEPIKTDLQLDDVEIGLLSGLAFGIFYSVMGLPLGWLVDRRSRRTLLAVAIATWSIATAACGLATSFSGLFAARVFVGVGEAALAPAALSMITDLFPPVRRQIAISVFVSAGSVGGGLAFVLGGALTAWAQTLSTSLAAIIGQRAPWQIVFMTLGSLGLPLSALVILTGEPPRRRAAVPLEVHGLGPFLRAERGTVGLLIAAMAGLAIVSYGTLTWTPSMLIRVHGWTAARVGLSFGATFLVAGAGGALSGGLLAARLRRHFAGRANLLIVSIALALLVIPSVLAPLVQDARICLVLYGAILFLFALPSGVAVAFLQEVAPPDLRGRTSACYYVAMNLAGLTLGPLLVAVASKHLFGGALPPALALVSGIGSAGAAILATVAFLNARYPHRPPILPLQSRGAMSSGRGGLVGDRE